MLRAKTITGALTLLLSLLVPVFVDAQTLHITPALIDESHTLEQALMTMKSSASTTVEGLGGILEITYESSEPLEIYMVPMQKNESYVPTDYMRFTLPASEEGTVAIDLTVSPGWSLRNQHWLVHLLGKEETTNAAFSTIEFKTEGSKNVVVAATRHLLTKEFYTPGSYHALRGYRMLGRSFPIMFGILTIIGVLLCCILSPNKHCRRSVLGTLLIGSFLYQARFSIDLLRYTREHTQEYAEGTYDEAGSIHALADVLISLVKNPSATTVYVCRDGTNFKEKLLRYFSYPIRISSELGVAATADYAVVMDKYEWEFDTTVTKDETTLIVKCGDMNRRAQKLSTYPSNEILFRLLAPSTR
ncbi:hypothetical protein EXS65_01260 [Candidatus Peribacteria bacterium]|nr:hypothetical protein [Candidatus Peribacteria bacterium]